MSSEADEGPPAAAQDNDYELARRLQEQEAAMYQIREQREAQSMLEIGSFGNLDRMMSEDSLEDLAAGSNVHSSEDESEPNDRVEIGDVLLPQPENSTGPASEIDDEEFARRLHVQEQIDQQRRFMEMAGITSEEYDDNGEEDILDDDDIEDDDDDDDDDHDDSYFTEDSIDPDEMTYEELRALGDSVGVVSRGLAPEIIANLPQSTYVHPSEKPKTVSKLAGTLHWGLDQDEQCVVCRMEFETGNCVKTLPCQHVFHPECIDKWLAINKACPICGCEVSSAGQVQIDADASASKDVLAKLS